ncbi:hypothetical protein H5410_059818 [Solanum commersonii]|uniref:LysM domain-containing protein n=1 Tax=Solanum commersonii TaxID=4109 RepID=A0A9J5W447_SOLCO|nr:hypothetical protein H5410_059818 [Solanum commersonii]
MSGKKTNQTAKKLAIFLSFLLIALAVESRQTAISGKNDAKLVCNSVHGAELGDTCASVGNRFKLTGIEFGALNPNMNCLDIFVGQWLCVNGSA